MKQADIYGIKNCDTMKKAFVWLDKHKIAYVFHDYKKEGADAAVLQSAIKTLGWETVINCKGTTWRALPDAVKESMNDKSALKTALDNPSVIKRPLTVYNNAVHVGFDETEYVRMFKK